MLFILISNKNTFYMQCNSPMMDGCAVKLGYEC